MVLGGQDAGGCAGGHSGQNHADAGYQRRNLQQKADGVESHRHHEQPQQAVGQDFSVEKSENIGVRQNHADDHHGQGRVAVADGGNGVFRHGGELPLGQHQDQANKAGDDAGVGGDLFQCSLPVGALSVDGDAGGPHHDPHGDQENAGHSKADGAEDSFRHGISKETGVGADDTVLEAHAVAHFLFSVEYFSDDDTADLDGDGDDQHQGKLPENLVVKVDQEGFDDVAGKHQIDDQIVNIFLTGGADNADLFYKCSDEDQKEHGNLQYKYVAHDVCLFSVMSWLPSLLYRLEREMPSCSAACFFPARSWP